MITTNTFEEIVADDVVQFISSRHHTTPQTIIDSVAATGMGNTDASGEPGVCLEENEIRIIRDLIRMYDKKK